MGMPMGSIDMMFVILALPSIAESFYTSLSLSI
jgi:hypothetical protein